MNFRRSFSLLLPFLAANLHAQIVPVVHTFDDPVTFPTGVWTGSGGWSTAESGGYFQVSENGGDGSHFIGFYDVGASVGATAWRSMSAPAASEQFSVGFNYWTGNAWGTQVGLGPEVSYSNSLLINVAQYEGPRVYLSLGGVAASGAVTFDTSWFDVRVDVNLAANGGAGSATAYARSVGSSTWNAISGITNINLGLDTTRTATDGTNPLNWNTLWFHHEGATSGIDNISLSAIPEPSTYAAFAGAAMLGLAVWRRRQLPKRIAPPV